MVLLNRDDSGVSGISADALIVARAVALHWTWQPRTATYNLVRQFGAKSASGGVFTQEKIKLAQAELKGAGMLVEHSKRQGYWRLEGGVRAVLYRQLLAEVPAARLKSALQEAHPHHRQYRGYVQPIGDTESAVALLCLDLFSGASAKTLRAFQDQLPYYLDWSAIIHCACFDPFDAALFDRITPEWRWELTFFACSAVCDHWSLEYLPCLEWALAKVDAGNETIPPTVRWQLSIALLLRGETQRSTAVLGADTDGQSEAIRAALLAQEGRWVQAQAGFELALKQLQQLLRRRKNLLPQGIAWLYPLSLLAQQTPVHLELARKFCKAEAGPVNSYTGDGWRIWVHAISVRLGDEPIEPVMFDSALRYEISLQGLWMSLMRAWLGPEAFGQRENANAAAPREAKIGKITERLRACGFRWLIEQLDAAEAVFDAREPPARFFIQGAREAWRGVLASLQALGGDTVVARQPGASRILWAISIDRAGGIESVMPMEQKRGPRGWSKPRASVLSKIAKSTKLEPWDAKVARAIRQERYSAQSFTVDRAAAIVALIGHPAVVMSDAPEITVDLVEGTPELEVLRKGEAYVLKITPEVRETPARQHGAYYLDDNEQRESEALRYITLQRDSPQRVRLIRLSPAQRRAAQLVSGRFSVPASAQADLQQTLQSLAPHFQIQSDHVEAAREIPAEPRLRAELAPIGESLLLRLVVAPLGIDGPRLMPGRGRARVMAAIKGESVGTERDLDAERAGLDEVLAAFDFLDPPARGDGVCEWRVDHPEDALGLVEALPTMSAIHAVDWPRGQPVRIVTVGSAGLTLQVRTERDWFKLQGTAKLDEGLVMDLKSLLAAAAGKTRFVPMGKGVYAALTRELRDKLADLGAVGEAQGDELQVPQLAAVWLDDVLQGVDVDTDSAFSEKVERLRAGQELRPAVPAGLQAELRSYQEDGYVWAMRLAQAGFGAILADDMGLGKTVQTLGVLLARAAGGPALVVAPTSVCGNWLAETLRFAPTLNAMIYGEGDRTRIVESAGPGDLVIVSYTLMQQAHEMFAAKTWHTLVADEAQAVKNAAARRTLALLDLPADFRLALSGTPIENRLAELWSIMRFCNPGLLGTGARFTAKFATPIERDRDREAQRLLRRLIAPFVMRRTKSQVLEDLPPRTELVLSVVPDTVEAAHYEALRRDALSAAESVVANDQAGQAHLHILAQLTRLRRAACDPRLVSPDLAIMGAKVRAFADLTAELAANGHKALVFSQFVDFLTLLRVPLDEAGIRYQYLDGSTPAPERSKRVAAFQAGEGDLFLISLKAGGFGLNLTAADYVVITDPWWNPAAEDQAMGRAHRIGQVRPVTVYRLIAKGTLEERIVELHHEKRALAEGMLADGGEGAVIPSTAELIALMRGE